MADDTARPSTADLAPMRALYVDLDGTLLGKGASLLHDGEGNVTLLGARALEACHRAEVEVVIMSGRKQAQVVEDARLIGSSSYICEVGSIVVVDGEEEFLTGELQPDELSIFEQVGERGAPQLLLERYNGKLEHHAPWHTERQVSHLFRGEVDLQEANELLIEQGHTELQLIDNGIIERKFDSLPDCDQPRTYHLIPSAASKARAVARHMQARQYEPSECIAVGDSHEDLAVADVVGTFWFVANALTSDPSLRSAAAALSNVRVAEASNGAGVYEAVLSSLAERR